MSKNKTKNNVLSAQAEKQLLNQLANNGIIVRNNKKKPRKRAKGGKLNNFGNMVQMPISSTRETRANNRRPNIYHTGPQREFVTTLLGSTGNFEVKLSLIMNAGNPGFSPWLAGLARQYESYKFKYLRIKYVARCPTTTTGWVAISPDCNPHDVAPNSELSAFQNKNTVSQAPYKEFEVRFENDMLNKRKTYFCRKDGSLPDGADKDLYDVGNAFIICGGNTVGTPLGQIWVEYDCEFHTPEYAPSINNSLLAQNTVGVTQAEPFGTNADRVVQEIGQFAQIGPNALTFTKPFHGLLNITHNGTGMSGLPSITGGTALYNIIENGVNLNSTYLAGTIRSGLTSMLQANSGDALTFLGPLGTLSGVNFGLTPCLL